MVRVLHVSDLHLEAGLAEAPRADFMSKRAIGYANLALRRRGHFAGAEAKVDALVRFADRSEVDLVLCTGDYTALGTRTEIEAARARVAKLFDRPRGFATVPGNHDLYVDDDGTFERAFADGLRSDLPAYVWSRGEPYVRLEGDSLAIIGLRSAKPNAIHDSSGRVPASELEALGRILEEPELRRRFVLVAVHYAPRLWNGRPDSFRHGLANHEALIEVLREARSAALVFGHVHHGYAVTVPGARTPLVCAGSATYGGRESAVLWEIDGGCALGRGLGYTDGEFVDRGVWAEVAYG